MFVARPIQHLSYRPLGNWFLSSACLGHIVDTFPRLNMSSSSTINVSSIPTTHSALYLAKFISSKDALLHELSLTQVPLSRTLSSHDVLIRINYASINPSDVKNAMGQMTSTRLPRILGRDFCGIVVATGESEEARTWLGTTCYGTGGDLGFERDGTHAQYITLPISGITRVPQSLSLVQAGSVGVNYCTAMHGLSRGGLSRDDIVLVTGSNGGVGSAVVQLAKRAGATVIGILRSRPTTTSASTMGGTNTTSSLPLKSDVDIYLSDLKEGFASLPQAVRELPLIQEKFSNEPVDDHHRRGATLIFDVLGGDVVPHLLSSLATRGRMVCIAMPLPHTGVSINGLELYRQELSLIGVNSLLLSHVECAALLRQLTKGFDSGELQTRDAATTTIVKPGQIAQAYADVAAGKAKGKLVINFSD